MDGTRVAAARSTHAQRVRWRLPAVALVWLGTWLVFALNFRHPALPERMGGWNGFDYRDTFYVPIRDLMQGHMPWDLHGYHQRHPASQMVPLYLPSYWLVAMPFLLLPYRVGLFAWLGVLAAAAVALAWFTAQQFLPRLMTTRRMAGFAGVLVAGLATPPLRSGILAANWAPLCAAAAIAAAWLSLPWTPWPATRRRRWTLVALTCLAVVKPQVGIALLLVQLCVGAWRVAAIAWGISLALAAPVGVLAWRASGSLSRMASLVRETIAQGEGLPLSDPTSTRIDLLGALGHLSMRPGMFVSLAWELIVLAACLTAVRSSARRGRQGADGATALTITSMGLSLLLVTPNLLYAAPVLIPGIVALGGWLLARLRDTRRLPWAQALLWAMLVFPFVNLRSLAPRLGYSPTLTNALNGFDLNMALIVLLLIIIASPSTRNATLD